MKTVFVTGSDTGVGKTWVAGALAARFASMGKRIQIVKPIESGATEPDAEMAARRVGLPQVEAYTLRSLSEPIAPVAAAERDRAELDIDAIVDEMKALSDCDLRIVEGAGSIATPIDANGTDWADFAIRIEAAVTVLVVDFKLGAIGQSRLAYAYAMGRGLKAGLWLNQTQVEEERVLQSTLEGIEQCKMPLWGVQRLGRQDAEWTGFPAVF